MPESKPFPKKLLLIATGLLLIVAIFINMNGNKQSIKPTQPANQSVGITSAPSNTQTAILLATQLARLQPTVPAGWEIKDTTAQTEGKPSFTLFSKRQDQKLLFVIWDNISPADNLDLITFKVPFTSYGPILYKDAFKIKNGQQTIGGEPFNWFVGRYPYKDADQMCMVGAYRSSVPGKAVIVIGQPYSENNKLDYQTSLWLIDTMAASSPVPTINEVKPPESAAPVVLATPQELIAFKLKIKSLIKDSLNNSMAGIGKKKITVEFALDNDGKVSKLIISKPSGDDDLDQALVNAITNSQPFPAPPNIKNGTLLLHATISGAELTID